jgi:hypothetical protein
MRAERTIEAESVAALSAYRRAGGRNSLRPPGLADALSRRLIFFDFVVPLRRRGAVDPILRFSGAVDRDPTIDRWLNKQAGELGSIAQHWFDVMRSCGNDVRELMHDGCPVACVQDAPFGYVNVFKAHVNVGFFFGAVLADPTGLLEGSGKRMRHVKIKPGVAVDSMALAKLIDAAYLDIRARLGVD